MARIDAGETLGVGALADMLRLLGLESLLETRDPDAPDELRRLAEERDAARAARDFERADAIREELAAQGWEIRDTPDGAKLVPLS